MTKKGSLNEIERDVLREAIDEIQKNQGRKKLHDPQVKAIIEIVEQFLKKKKTHLLWRDSH